MSDRRFTKIHSDPRFRSIPIREKTHMLDERFTGLLTDSKFRPPSCNIDEKGRQVKESAPDFASSFSFPQRVCTDEQGKFKWDVESSSSSSLGMDEEEEDIWIEEEPPLTESQTSRLSVMNCDWSVIKAIDLLTLFRSFSSGVLKVDIFMSQFGKDRMKKEKMGPVGNFGGNPEEPDLKALRKYELEQLKCYFAIVYCENSQVAEKLYEECDGLEIERTGNTVDLRVVPEDVTIEGKPEDTAEDVPYNYEPTTFYTKALQHSKVELTWDMNPPSRSEALERAFKSADPFQVDLSKYVATPSSEEEELSPSEGNYEQNYGKVSQFNMLKDKEISIRFTSAFDEISQKVTQSEDLSQWEKHLEEKKEKKRKRRAQMKETLKKKKEMKADRKTRETLELLVDDHEKIEFTPDLDDPRFKALYSDPKFSIDPTSSYYQKDKDGNALVLKHQSRKRKIN